MAQKQPPQQYNHIHYYDEIEQGSEEWKLLRAGKISGSTAHKLLGKTLPKLSSFNNANDTFTGNFATKRGHLLEPEAIEIYERINGVKVLLTGYVTNDKYPNCLYSPDGYLDDRTIEVKCFLPKHHLECIQRTDTKILAQCHFGQMIMEKPLTDLILYCPKSEVPIDQMFVVKQLKENSKIQDNFKKRIEIINGRA